ncbi:MAG: hypothetical protein J1E95_01135 [Muribaculaceae bacterium]|nr:hypothetical protein [Muribaculaceae bacterium]
MRQTIKNSPFGILVLILGAAIIVAGILTMALYHDMSWQSYVVIGALMISALWAMFNVPAYIKVQRQKVPVRNQRDDIEL